MYSIKSHPYLPLWFLKLNFDFHSLLKFGGIGIDDLFKDRRGMAMRLFYEPEYIYFSIAVEILIYWRT